MILEEPLTLLVNQWSHDYYLGFHIVHVTAGKFCSMALIAVLTSSTWKSVCIISILFSAHLLMCWQREFVLQLKVSLVGDYFLYSHDINVWFSGDNVGRN